MVDYKSGRFVALALLVFAAALSVVALVGRPRISLRTQSPRELPRLAVLPFQNLSGDPELQVLASQIAVAVSESLGETDRFRLVAREMTAGYAVAREGIEEAARKLGADYVIAGSVARRERRIEVDAYFFRAGPEPGLWAERLHWKAGERESVASDLAERLRVAFEERSPWR